MRRVQRPLYGDLIVAPNGCCSPIVAMVAFYQTIADVVVFDQRGAGHSLPVMKCPQTAHYPNDEAVDWERVRHLMRDLLARCRGQWQRRGVDLAAYNTAENAADVDELREALGYRSMTLIGGSYGSHLALQVMRLYPHRVDRVVLYGVEGLDQTWDSPDGLLASLRRIALATEAHAEQLRLQIPEGGLLGAWSRVIEHLEAHPETVTVKQNGKAIRVVVDANLVRLMIRHKAGSHDYPKVWPELILAMDRGDYSQAGRAALDYRTFRMADPMHWSMDCASSISDARRRRYEQSEAVTLLGDINREYSMLCDLWPTRDLGKGYRANVGSSIPTLLFQGTWDTATPRLSPNRGQAWLTVRTLYVLFDEEVIRGTEHYPRADSCERINTRSHSPPNRRGWFPCTCPSCRAPYRAWS